MNHACLEPFSGIDLERSIARTGIAVAAGNLIQRNRDILFPDKFNSAAFADRLKVLRRAKRVLPAEKHPASVPEVCRKLHGHRGPRITAVLSVFESILCRIIYDGAALVGIKHAIVIPGFCGTRFGKYDTHENEIRRPIVDFQICRNSRIRNRKDGLGLQFHRGTRLPFHNEPAPCKIHRGAFRLGTVDRQFLFPLNSFCRPVE
ncbi:MAG: hypothetical protein BWY31_04262 [Lentisphaerae bacterium ADurb.Bin242]|nr:MAG: hypothetical protein BWY31_04262 [Lentisphaerae bacterium ADurb.Bin242]